MENFESLEIGDSIMSDWAQIISDALDILKFDGAVQDTLAELRESTPFLVTQSLLLSRLTGADITSGKCLHRIFVNKVIARNGLRLPAAISKY